MAPTLGDKDSDAGEDRKNGPLGSGIKFKKKLHRPIPRNLAQCKGTGLL